MGKMKAFLRIVIGLAIGLSVAVIPVYAESNNGMNNIGSAENIIFTDSGDGVYFVSRNDEGSGYNVDFYSLQSKTYKCVYTIDNANNAYSDDNGAYFIYTDYDSNYDYDTETWEFDYNYTFYSYNFKTGISARMTLDAPDDMDYISCMGVDGKGRIYVVSHAKLFLFSESGAFLSSTEYTGYIGEFYGFDNTNGNFYYRGTYNWVYWGYDHDMASLMAGNVDSSNNVHVKEGNIVQLFQSYWYEHEKPVAMLNGKYLAVLSTFSGDTCVILDSNKYTYTDVTEQSTTISMLTSGVSVSLVNISNENAIVTAVQTADSDYGSAGNGTDQSSVGVRCDVSKTGTSLIVKTDTNILTEYDIKTGKEKIKAKTTHPIYAFGMEGDKCVVVEKDGDSYYVEAFDWVYPKNFSVNAKNKFTVGETARIVCSTTGMMSMDYTFESSNTNVVSVDAKGQLNAWKKGTAKITVKASQIGVSKTFTVTVNDSSLSKSNSTYKIVNAIGTTSANMHVSAADTGYYAATVKNSYLTQLSNGHFERVEYIKGKIVREEYDSSYNLLSVKRIKKELTYFGGFYSGKTYNYLVFGQANTKQNDKKEVFRIVKYSKTWKRLSACTIKGANTYCPFDAGGLDMTETNGKLYVYTCHTMYNDGDGYHHQANCTFVINESDMKLVDSYYDVMNLSYGYVSHSFAQQIETDGTNIYRADLGDANPRGIAFTVTKADKLIYNPSIYGTLIDIPGDYGDNYTGFTLSDMKLSTNNYLIAGTGLRSSNSTAANIYISVGDKLAPELGATWLTNYSKSSRIRVYSPKLVKLKSTQFLVMWEEKNLKTRKYRTRMVLIGEGGEQASKVYTISLALSECDPIVTKSGKVVWYVTNNDSPIFIEVNPYNLAKVETKAKKDKSFKKDNTQKFSNADKSGYSTGDVIISSKRIFKLTSSKTVSMCGVVGKKTRITVPNTIKLGGKTYKVTSIGQGAFRNQTRLKSVAIGKNVKTIGAYAFSKCKALVSVSGGRNVTTIGGYSFYACTSLRSITVPSKVSKIGKRAFARCKKLKMIEIKSEKLTSKKVGTAAIKGISSKAVIKTPGTKTSAYKKIFMKKGATKKMTFKEAN